MFGIAESHDGLSRKLVAFLKIGKDYDLDDLARLLGRERTSISGQGVITNARGDAQLLMVTLEKDKYATPGYIDHRSGSTLFWTGQNNLKTVENNLKKGTHDTFVFIQDKRRSPYIYFGRAVPVRSQIIWEKGTPSHIVFELVEYADIQNAEVKPAASDEEIRNTPTEKYAAATKTEASVVAKVRTVQSIYRDNVLSFWEHKCAVTGVDETSWLIASHIKPWRESSNEERTDPHNSLLLTPDYDKLFDRGVISFSPDTGKIILPEQQSRKMWTNLSKLHIDESVTLRDVPDGVDEYLAYHNKYVYNFTPSDSRTSDEEFVEELIVRGLA